MRTLRLLIASVGLLLFGAADAPAAIMTFSTSQSQFDAGVDNHGWWSSTLSNDDDNDHYFTGFFGQHDLRSFFTFDLKSLTAVDIIITSANVRLTRFESLSTNEATEDLGIFDVTTNAATLNNNDGVNTGIFTDLGSGVSYGTFNVPGSGSQSVVLSFSLNAAALAHINAAKGAFFSIGIDLLSQDGNDALFVNSGNDGTQELVLNVEPLAAVPEPATLTIWGLGALGFLIAGYRRRRVPVTI